MLFSVVSWQPSNLQIFQHWWTFQDLELKALSSLSCLPSVKVTECVGVPSATFPAWSLKSPFSRANNSGSGNLVPSTIKKRLGAFCLFLFQFSANPKIANLLSLRVVRAVGARIFFRRWYSQQPRSGLDPVLIMTPTLADRGEKLHSETLFLYFCWTLSLYRLLLLQVKCAPAGEFSKNQRISREI